MGKRSSFERVPRDFYPTPYAAVVPLLPHLPAQTTFIEPCAGDGTLVAHLEKHGHKCLAAFDIEPRGDGIVKTDASAIYLTRKPDCWITNPPWSRDILHRIIVNLSRQLPSWLLFDADWPHTKQSVELMPLCRKIVSVGRVKWIPDSPFTGKDNCCWYLFDANAEGATEFVRRAA